MGKEVLVGMLVAVRFMATLVAVRFVATLMAVRFVVALMAGPLLLLPLLEHTCLDPYPLSIHHRLVAPPYHQQLLLPCPGH